MSVTESFIVDCPSCGKRLTCPAQLAGKRAKCKCGQSILCPTTPGQAAQAAGPATGAALGYRTAPTADKNAAAGEHSALIRQAVLYSLLLAVIVGAVFGLRYLGGSSRGGGASAQPTLGEDATVEEMISNEDGTEAREWLAGRPGRMLSGMTTSQAENRIDHWYKLGATKVYAFGGGLSMTVALQLPPDPAKRNTLFDWVNNWHQGTSTRPATDVGQKYLLVRLRL